MGDRWPERQFVGVKIGVRGVEWLDNIVMEENGRDIEANLTRSDGIRMALVIARRHEKEYRDLLRSNR